MSLGPWQIILVVVLIVLLFGRGKISALMGDVAKGIKSFKKGLAEDELPEPDVENLTEVTHAREDGVKVEAEAKKDKSA